MLSRVAENLYWFARYMERAESTARLILVNAHLDMDSPKSLRPGWAPLLLITGIELEEIDQAVDERTVVRQLIADLKTPSSILFSLQQAREDVRTVRDCLPREAWESINELTIRSRDNAQAGIGRRGRFEYLRSITTGVQHINGMLESAMAHDEGYQFIMLGRYLERCDMTLRMIDVRSRNLLPDSNEQLSAFHNIQWMSLLKSLSGYQMYRRSMQVRVQRATVLEFLFLSNTFPRSTLFGIDQVESFLKALPRNRKLVALLKPIRNHLLSAKPQDLEQDKLQIFIDKLEEELVDLGNSIAQTYFHV